MTKTRLTLLLASVVNYSATAESVLVPPPPPQALFDKVSLSDTSLSPPALALFRDKVFITWRGLDNHLNVMSSWDGRNFLGKVTLQEISYSAPALAYFRGRLFIGWREP